ncbi:unnamed protein product, partial [Urochloa humidicola]
FFLTKKKKKKKRNQRSFLHDAVPPSIPIAVLRSCESQLPTAEDANLVARLIAAIASNVCSGSPPSSSTTTTSRLVGEVGGRARARLLRSTSSSGCSPP